MNFITRSESNTAKSNLPEVIMNVIMSIKESFHIQMYISGSGPMNISSSFSKTHLQKQSRQGHWR